MFYVWWPLWPDLDLEPSLISNIYSISVLPYISGVLDVSFGPKLIILRSLRLVTWKPRFWHLTWPWPDTWPHLENLGNALGSSHRELSNAASFVSLRPFVRELWRGAFNAPPPPASRGWRSTPANAGLTNANHSCFFFLHQNEANKISTNMCCFDKITKAPTTIDPTI